MQVHRIDTELELRLSADTSCSVVWLIPGSDRGELAAVMAAVMSRTGREAWGFLGRWDQSRKLDAYAGPLQASARLPATLSIGGTRLLADALDLGTGGDWFWPLFGGQVRAHETCAALVSPGTASPAGWTHAGLLLVLEQASQQVRPGRASGSYTLRSHQHAFIAETVRAGAIAVTRLTAELLAPGIALTGSAPLIDDIVTGLPDAAPVPAQLTARSIQLNGNW